MGEINTTIEVEAGEGPAEEDAEVLLNKVQ